jgi:hypothetical protein
MGRDLTTLRPVDALDRLWTGGETHIAIEVRHSMNGTCFECAHSPARVYVQGRLLCGVCWNKVMWLRWARKETSA